MTRANRRGFLRVSLATGAAALSARRGWTAEQRQPPPVTRGVVLVPEDLTLADWPDRAQRAGLSTIGIHHQNSPRAVVTWTKSDAGQAFHERCRTLGIAVEYELHAMQELLPRSLFSREPSCFRMDAQGRRTADCNCCVHSKTALELIAENAIAVAEVLRPTTGRYFYWGDDGRPWCQCPACGAFSAAEQSLIVANAIWRALKRVDERARLAHLAYANTLQPPRQVRPEDGIFLEYAPIQRRYDAAYEEQRRANQADPIAALDANLEVFPRDTAQVLEYWLDVSRFSRWRRPGVKLPWRRDVFLADVAAYRRRGIRHITSFAAWLDADYLRRHGDLDFLGEYGAGLNAG